MDLVELKNQGMGIVSVSVYLQIIAQEICAYVTERDLDVIWKRKYH